VRHYAYGTVRAGNNARYYDPTLGTFLSPDTLVPDAGVLFDYNRYLYTRGNPLKYTDPSGHVAVCFHGGPNTGGKGEGEAVSPIHEICNAALDAAGYDQTRLIAWYNGGLSKWEAIDLILANPDEPTILIGHSWGGAAALEVASMLNDMSVGVDLLITIDPEPFGRRAMPTAVPDNVKQAVNIAPKDGWRRSVTDNSWLARNSRNRWWALPMGRALLGGKDHSLNAQNGVNNIEGALNVDLEYVEGVRMDHDSIVDLNYGRDSTIRTNPVVESLMTDAIRSILP
jgi:RHS repeat-associated protein